MSGCHCSSATDLRVTGEVWDRSSPDAVGAGSKTVRVRCAQCGGKVGRIGSDVLTQLFDIPADGGPHMILLTKQVKSYYSAEKLDERQNNRLTDASLAGQFHKGEPLNSSLLWAVHNDCNGQPVACAISAHMANYQFRYSDDQANRDDPPAATPESIRTPSYVHHVHPGDSRVDSKNRSTALPFRFCVHMSTPISYSTVSREEKKRTKTCLITYKYEIGVDIRTWIQNRTAVTRFLMSTLIFRGWTGWTWQATESNGVAA
jgi:hypothetical protein